MFISEKYIKVIKSIKFILFRFFGWGSGLVTADANTWKVHRKLLNSAFTLKSLQNFIPIFHEGSQEFVRHIGHNLGKGEFNLLEYAVKATLDSICGEFCFYFYKVRISVRKVFQHV